ncbi:unnamed protein product [Eruca vesicaria subsp. sativa]|uniref:Uncharacterized protein n=1 Tax=Eruca vesicaria subsp. sativa TaxID=29727 RepID=A0ABC8J9L4_ERUVS|nr:unnamed protein product [Eruca vesicaria subsp. sativa]
MDRLNIPLGSLVLTLLCGIHSRSALGITSSSGWNSSQNPTTSPTLLPLTVSRTSIETEWFHVLSSIGYSSLEAQQHISRLWGLELIILTAYNESDSTQRFRMPIREAISPVWRIA